MVSFLSPYTMHDFTMFMELTSSGPIMPYVVLGLDKTVQF